MDNDIVDEVIDELIGDIRGSMCSISGSLYETKVHNVVRRCVTPLNQFFNTQSELDLGGSSSSPDLSCVWNGVMVHIECKHNAVDWGQSKAVLEGGRWLHKDPIVSDILNEGKLFDFKLPPPMCQDILHKDWLIMKKSNKTWDDRYFNISSNRIKEYYRQKGCSYIQINTNGLFHLGQDVCNFGVPEFNSDQKLRVRVKVHGRKLRKRKYTYVSVMCSHMSKKLKVSSRYSLDNPERLPPGLLFTDNNYFR